MVGANESLITSSSKLVGGKNLATGPGREGLEDAEVDQLLDESNTAVGEQEVGATGMKRPVLVAMGEARGGVGPVSFAGVREDERPASFGVEARFGLERHQRNGRVGDGRPVKSSFDAACRREQGLPLGRIARCHCNRRSSRNQMASWHPVILFGRRRVDDDRDSSGQSGSDKQNNHVPGVRDRDSLPGARATNLEKLSMKLIIALIQPTKLEAVKEALSRVEVFRLTVMDVQGFGRQKGYTEVYRGHEVTVNLLRKIELQIAVNEDFVEPTVNAILEAGRSGPDGKIGDGKIFILPLDDCIRIRTGERGPEAI